MKNITYINAGAGSGKTTELTKTLAQLLKEGKCKPSEVILTTFTEAAAAEFRQKARAKLYENNMPEVASQFAAATIGTVHSVALQFVQKYWYLIGITPDLKIMTDDDMKVYTSQSLANFITDEQLQFFNGYVDFFGIDKPDFWRKDLNDVINKLNSYNIDLEGLKASRKHSLETIDTIFPGNEVVLEVDLIKKFQDSMNIFDTETANAIINAVRDIRSWQIDESHPLSYATAIKLKNHTDANGTFSSARRGDRICRLDRIKAEMGEENFNRLADNLSDYIQAAPRERMKKMVNHIFDIAEKWNKEFLDFKKENHIIDYNDMERLFLELLDQDAVKQEIQGTYRLLMVDEFQDSNPIQLKIFNRLSEIIAEAEGRSFWVGDPKQSIYGFRGTDVELVKNLVDQLKEQEDTNGIKVGTLEYSWRSRPQLVNLVSDCFVRAYNGVLDINQVKLEPKREDLIELDAPLMHWNLEGRNQELRASALATRVRKLVDSNTKVMDKDSKEVRNLQPGDIAILCRSNKDCNALAQCLKSAGVPTAVINSDITQQIEVQLVIALLNMMVSPNNKHVRADVLHLLSDKSTQDILRDRLGYCNDLKQKPEDEPNDDKWQDDDPLIQNLLSYRKQLVNMSVSDMVQSLIYGLGLNEVVAKWGDKAERQQNLATLLDLARQYDDSCVNIGIGASVNGFISYLTTIELEPEFDNTVNAVKVLTYHKAKGLEWNYVILTSLEHDALENQKFAKNSFWNVNELRHEDGSYWIQYLSRIWATDNNHLDANTINAIQNLDFYTSLRQRITNEQRNLLYVGMTRARDYLVTTGKTNSVLNWVTNTGISAGNADNLWQYDGLQPEIETLQQVDNTNIEMPTQEQRIAYPEHKEVSDEPKYLSPSKMKLPIGETVNFEIVARLGDRMADESIKNGLESTFGTCIHNIFAVYDPAQPREENIARAKRIRDGYDLRDALPDPASVIDSIEALYSYLKKTYGAAERVEHEVPFIHAVDGQVVHGEIDLLWYTAPNECVLVDFKNYPGKENSILDPADKHYAGKYAPQLEAYRHVLTEAGVTVRDTLIYYSVLRRVVKFK